jgi:hypothetical protein
MNKIVELKVLDDSVDSSKYEGVRGDTASFWSAGRRELLCHPLTVEISTQNFQLTQQRTNENINTYLFINAIYDENYSFTWMDKRGKMGLSFSKLSNKIVEGEDFQTLHEGSASTWTENFAEIKIISKLQLGSNSIIKRLRKFSTLKAGWDSYNAKPIEWLTISRAINFFYNVLYVMESKNKDVIPLPFVAPRSDGGIEFEWNTCYKELIIFIPEDEKQFIEYLKVDKTEDEEKEEEEETSNIEDLTNIVTDWLL